jgi:hypothetical protein
MARTQTRGPLLSPSRRQLCTNVAASGMLPFVKVLPASAAPPSPAASASAPKMVYLGRPYGLLGFPKRNPATAAWLYRNKINPNAPPSIREASAQVNARPPYVQLPGGNLLSVRIKSAAGPARLSGPQAASGGPSNFIASSFVLVDQLLTSLIAETIYFVCSSS